MFFLLGCVLHTRPFLEASCTPHGACISRPPMHGAVSRIGVRVRSCEAVRVGVRWCSRVVFDVLTIVLSTEPPACRAAGGAGGAGREGARTGPRCSIHDPERGRARPRPRRARGGTRGPPRTRRLLWGFRHFFSPNTKHTSARPPTRQQMARHTRHTTT